MTAPTATVDGTPGPDAHRPIAAGQWAEPLSGLRGLASVVVVVGHTFFATRLFPFTGVIHFLSIIVPLFFVVSSFALYRPFMAAHLAGADAPRASTFWWRRFLRIYPLYAFALTLYLILLPGVRPESGRVIDYLKLYGFMQIYDPDLVRFSGIPAAWFVCDEVVFYLMIPFIALLARWLAVRQSGPRRATRPEAILKAHQTIAWAMIVMGQVSRTWLLHIDYPGATSLPVSNLDFYGFGILLAAGSLRDHAGLPIARPVDWVRRRPWFALVVMALGVGAMNIVANVAGTTAGRTEDIQRYTVYCVLIVPFMIVMTLGVQDRGFNRWFASHRWQFLALLSLHVYLWHQLVLGGFDRYVTQVAELRFVNPFVSGLVLCTGAVVATVAWSALWRPGLDHPYKRWSALIPRSPDAAPFPRWAKPIALTVAFAFLLGGVWVAIVYGGSPMQARGGVGLITVTDANPGDTLVIRNQRGVVTSTTVDAQGTSVIWDLAPGAYQVRQERGDKRILVRDVAVAAVEDHPRPSFYAGRSLEPGLQWITTRDGTRLSAYVHLPGPPDEGPYPTVVEYSGYQLGDDGATQPATEIARALGYATVSVNVRGTGCSGGAFQMLGDAQAADGYDVVETVARQPWVEGGTVGLVGFSYGGLGALEVASTAPPSLSSVAALSVYGEATDAFQPGAIPNSGFPVGWMQGLYAEAQPLGAPWIRARVEDGDRTCLENQLLHSHAVDIAARYTGDVPDDGRFDPLSPATWAPTIEVPVFLASQLQDATIGADLADHLGDFARAPLVKLVLTNGTHADSVSPQGLVRLDQFLSLYAAGEVPDELDTTQVLAETRPDVDPADVPVGPEPPVSFDGTGELDDARARYAAAGPVEVLLESGNGGRPEAAAAAMSMAFDAWPPSEAATATWHLRPGGRLEPVAGPDAPPATFRTDPTVSGDAYTIEGDDLLVNQVSAWEQPAVGTTTSWATPPLTADAVLVGSTEVDLWVRVDADDADLQVTLTEITDQGDEVMIQPGWRRVSDAVDDLEPGSWVQVPVRLGPIGHVVRAGSQLRLTVGTVGGGQVQWSFYPNEAGAAEVEVGQGGERSSALRLPVLGDVEIEAPAPGCGDLRGQPCRPDVPSGEDEGAR